jgi:hypothetical protein
MLNIGEDLLYTRKKVLHWKISKMKYVFGAMFLTNGLVAKMIVSIQVMHSK